MIEYFVYGYLVSVPIVLAVLLLCHFDICKRTLSLGELLYYLLASLTPLVNWFLLGRCILNWFDRSKLLDVVVWRKKN